MSTTEPEGPVSRADADPPIVSAEADGDELRAARIRKRRRRFGIAGAAVLFVLIIGVIGLSVWQVPYYRFSPGTLYPTESAIKVTGAPAYDDPGLINFTTVSQKKASFLEYQLARFDPAVEMIDAALIDGDRTQEQTRQLNLEMMQDSKQAASIVALRTLGYPVAIHGTGAVVRSVGKGLPAEAILHPNDTLVAIEGQPLETADDAIKALGAHKPGDTITLTVEAPPNVDTGEPGATRTETVTLGARQNDPSKALLGVDLGTRAPRYELPFTVDIDSKAVGGPSAGLAFTLGIIDVLTPGELTGGRTVAVTGSIDVNGHVGPIGGIRQKTFLAERSGATLFIVPKDEVSEAQQWAGPDLKIVGVDTIDEALAALRDNGGSTDVVQQAAAAHTAGTAGN